MTESEEIRWRLSERAAELEARLQDLQAATSATEPKGPVETGFFELMQSVDVARIKSYVREVQDNGYVIVADVLAPAVVRRVREGLAPMFAGTGRLYQRHSSSAANKQTIHVQNVLAKTDVVDEVGTNAVLRAAVAGVLGRDFILNAGAVAMSPDPGCDPQGLHRDDGFFALFPRPHLPLVVTAAIALDDFSAENGGTQVVPGSNTWPADRQPEAGEIKLCEMPAGSMLLWDGALLHGGGGNRTADQSRRTITFNYTRGWLRTQFNQYLSVPRERVLKMPAALQTDLGYHHSALGLGGCDTQDPLRYLQRLDTAGGDGQQHLLGRESRES